MSKIHPLSTHSHPLSTQSQPNICELMCQLPLKNTPSLFFAKPSFKSTTIQAPFLGNASIYCLFCVNLP